MRERMVRLACLWVFLSLMLFSQTLKKNYLTYIQQAAELGWQEYPDVIVNWKKDVKPSPLWGYDAPAQHIYLVDILGFLYQNTHDNTYADKARQILIEYGSLRDAYPKDYWKTRAEYRNGMPALSNFFFMPCLCARFPDQCQSGRPSSEQRQRALDQPRCIWQRGKFLQDLT